MIKWFSSESLSKEKEGNDGDVLNETNFDLISDEIGSKLDPILPINLPGSSIRKLKKEKKDIREKAIKNDLLTLNILNQIKNKISERDDNINLFKTENNNKRNQVDVDVVVDDDDDDDDDEGEEDEVIIERLDNKINLLLKNIETLKWGV